MIIEATAPSRISLFGGGTDLPSYADVFGGIVINLAINIRNRVTLYTGDELYDHSISKYPYDADPTLGYEILKHFGIGSGHMSGFVSKFDGFVGAGLGSSASFAVALIGAVIRATGKKIKRDEIASIAQYMEISLGWYGGKQDQLASAYGGFNLLHIGKQTVIIGYDRQIAESLISYVNLFFIGGTRSSGKIQKGLQKLTTQQIKILNELKDVAILADYAIKRQSMDTVGKLLHKAWELKKSSNKGVTSSKIDDIYEFARDNGAMSGKILGAGGAGYMMFFVPPEMQEGFIKKMSAKGFEKVDFELDINGLSTRIL